MIKYIVFYFLFTTWLGYFEYLKSKEEPKTKRERIRRKRIERAKEKVISEIYILEGGDKDKIAEGLDRFTFWGTLFLSWYIQPLVIGRRIFRFCKRCFRRV